MRFAGLEEFRENYGFCEWGFVGEHDRMILGMLWVDFEKITLCEVNAAKLIGRENFQVF